jgi:hypothetical protein
MKRTTQLALALALTSFTACKKDNADAGDKPAAAKPSDKAAAPKPIETGPFAGWDMAKRTAAFQGAHVTPGDALGTWDAWNVIGDKVTIWNGTAEKTRELKLVSPCEAKVIERSDGGSSSTTTHYTLLDGAIVTGLGDAGSRRGPEAIACISNKVFTLDAKGTCSEWSASMFDDGKYEQKPGTCGFRKDGDKEVFAATADGHETVLEVHGDALLSEQLARTHSEKTADFAAAKAARDKK